ncbi:MAG: DUF4129 domain-containing protein [Actinobacteria bacterium]|nr:MAG: DUF4129 domain-containing protein [Actinomycetota bacterium]
MRRARYAIAVLILAATLMAPSFADAAGATTSVSLADYVARVTEARTAVEAALPGVGEPSAAGQLGAVVRDRVISVESVTVSGASMPVEQGVLLSLVVRLDGARSETTRREAAEDMLAQLRSQEVALGQPGTPPAGDTALLEKILTDEGVVETLDARQRFQEFLQKLIDKVLRWLEGVTGAKSTQTTFRALYYLLLVLSVFVIAWVVFVLARRMRSVVARSDGSGDDTSGDAVIAAAEGLPDDALAFADAEAAAGRYRDAVRALFGGAARELVERGIVPRTRTRTDGELLADVALARPTVLPPLSELCDAFEPAWYGHIDPGADGYAAARAVYSKLVATLVGDAR